MFIRAFTPAIFVSCPDPIFYRIQKSETQYSVSNRVGGFNGNTLKLVKFMAVFEV